MVARTKSGAKPADVIGSKPKLPKGAKKASYPGFIEPALATLRGSPPAGARWLHEIKFDGYRLQVRIRSTPQVLFTRYGVLRGARASLPLWIGTTPFGLVVGVLSYAKGMSFIETGLFSATVFAGAAQLLVLDLWADPVPLVAAIIAAFVVNIRMAAMGAALAFWLDRLTGWRLWGTLATLVDHSFALSVKDQREGGRDAGYLLGAGIGLWTSWLLATRSDHILWRRDFA